MRAIRALLSLSALAAAAPALAQTTAPRTPAAEAEETGGISDIVVTAQRREQNLQRVPLAISAFDTAELERRQITRTLDIVTFVPNMEGHNNTTVGTANTYSLRALNNTESIATFDPPVGTYVDDIYISRQGANNFAFFDVERVEVLRGPQGTLFGRNTTGGAINIILRKPSDEVTGYVEGGYGKYDRRMARASIDVPLVAGKLLTKFSGYYAKDDGYVRNRTTGERFNFEDSFGVRGALRALISDSVTWDLSLDYNDNEATNVINFKAPGSRQRIGFTRQRQGVPLGPTLTPVPQLADQSIGNRARTTAVTSNIQIEGTIGTINFITGYRDLNQEIFSDSFDSLSSAGVTFASDYSILTTPSGLSTPGVADQTSKQFTQEVKLTGEIGDVIEYVAGVYYFDEKNDTYLLNINIPAVGVPSTVQARRIRNFTYAYAGYAQIDIKPTPALTLTVGARYTDETKKINFQPLPVPATAPRVPANLPFNNDNLRAAGIPTRLNTGLLTPRFAINYEIAPAVRIFASATRGFKSGGWNARANVGSQALSFAPEKIWSYEAGLRSDFLDRRVRVNVTGFYYKVKDFQLPAGFADTVTNTIVFITRNFADLENYGIEPEITVVPIDDLNITWAAGFQHARYRGIDPIVLAQAANCRTNRQQCDTGIVTLAGGIARPARAPAFSSVVGVNYTFRFGDRLELSPSGNWSHIKGHSIGTAGTAIAFQRTRDTYAAGITLRDRDAGWSIGADCTNCFNRSYVVSYLIYPYLNEPVRWMLRAKYDF